MSKTFEEAEQAVAAFQSGHTIMTMKECLAWIEEEKAKQARKLPAKPLPVTMEDLLDASAE